MSLAKTQHTNRTVVGAGELYVIDADDGERYLGDSDAATINVTTETITVEGGDGPVAETLARAATSVTRRMTLSLRDISADNLALFILGEAEDDAQAATAVADEQISGVRTGVWYQLKGSATPKAEGVYAISPTGVTVKVNATGASPLDDAKYEVDADLGRIKFTELTGVTGAIKVVRVSYTPKANTVRRAKSADAAAPEVGLRYIETATIGEGKRVYAPRCVITPNGDMALKSRSKEQSLPLTVDILEPDTGEALVIYGTE